MFPLPLTDIITVLIQFACVSSDRVWAHAVVLVVGAILDPRNALSRPPCQLRGWPTKNGSRSTTRC